MRSLSSHLILVLAVIGAFVGCQADPWSDGEPVIQDKQWPALLAQRENQPTSEWHTGGGWIDTVNSGWSHGWLTFRESPSGLAERTGEVLKRNPRVFVPLLASKDPGVVLTAISIYGERMWRDQMRREDCEAIAQGFRALLDHEDMRMRWAAVEALGENRMLTVSDIAKGLADESAEVRATAGMEIGSVQEGAEWDAKFGKALTTEGRIKISREIDRKLIPVLIAHLDDPDFRVRQACASNVTGVVPCKFAIKPPAYCDFVRAGWAECRQAKAAWQAWWKQHGEETLAAAD